MEGSRSARSEKFPADFGETCGKVCPGGKDFDLGTGGGGGGDEGASSLGGFGLVGGFTMESAAGAGEGRVSGLYSSSTGGTGGFGAGGSLLHVRKSAVASNRILICIFMWRTMIWFGVNVRREKY